MYSSFIARISRSDVSEVRDGKRVLEGNSHFHVFEGAALQLLLFFCHNVSGSSHEFTIDLLLVSVAYT